MTGSPKLHNSLQSNLQLHISLQLRITLYSLSHAHFWVIQLHLNDLIKSVLQLYPDSLNWQQCDFNIQKF